MTLDGVELLGLEPFERAQAGLFLTFQYPIEVPGVPLAAALAESLLAAGRSRRSRERLGSPRASPRRPPSSGSRRRSWRAR